MTRSIPSLHRTIVSCRACPRLVEWREHIAHVKTKRFLESDYWGKPVPGFGDPKAQLLLVGLAPAAHGANRTGRMFTGDESGKWLYRALYKAGFANQPGSTDKNDGLSLSNCYITAACRCAPPDNKPSHEELENCRPFILDEFRLLKELRVVVGLGRIGFDTAFDCMKALEWTHRSSRPTFSHGTVEQITSDIVLIGSYHPSQQNTFTGTLTEPMFNSIFRTARRYL